MNLEQLREEVCTVNRLLPFSLTGKWPDTLAGNRPSKAPIRYFGRFFGDIAT